MAKLKDTEINGNLSVTEDVQCANLSTSADIECGNNLNSTRLHTKYLKIDPSENVTSQYSALQFTHNNCSSINMTTASDANINVLRVNNGTTDPIVILGDGLYSNSIGTTNVVAGTKVFIKAGGTTYGVGYIRSENTFRPITTNQEYLGTSSYKWKAVYSNTASIQTSDEREKYDITAIADYPVMFSRTGNGNVLEMLFSKLIPKTYYLISEEDKPELHIGFVAQDVAAALEELGMTEDDLGLLVHDSWIDEETGEEKDAYGLRYEEFISLNTHMIKKANEKIATQQDEIDALKEIVNTLKQDVENLKNS